LSRETLNITEFGGIISNYDDKDIPDNIASDSSNIDGNATEGKACGIKDKADHSSHLAAVGNNFAWVKDYNNKWNLIHTYITSYVGVVEDFYGTPATTASGYATTGYSIVPKNQEAYIGCSSFTMWFGRIGHTQFSVAAPTAFYPCDAAVPLHGSHTSGDFRVVSVTGVAGTMVFDTSLTYYYAITAVYDGYQESPIGDGYYAVASPAWTANFSSFDVLIECCDGQSSPTSINKRITSIKVYRKEKKIEKDFVYDASAWKLQVEYDVTSSSGWTNVGGNWQRTYSDTNVKTFGNTYEQETGLSSISVTHSISGYLLQQANDYLFVTRRPTNNESNMLYRSMPKRYSLFDTVLSNNNYIHLPTAPLAMQSFAGKLWVFDENRVYKVNPDTLAIESTTEGVGCFSQRSIVVTEYGMFWLDSRSAYWHDGTDIVPISEPIKDTSGSYDWHGFSKSYTIGDWAYTPIVQFHSESKYVLFIIPYGSTGLVNNIWAYNIFKKRWDKWASYNTIVTVANVGAFTGRDGEVYLNNGDTKVYKMFAGSRKSWTWTSKTFDFNDPSQNKRFYELEASATGTPTIEYSKDGASLVNNATTPLDNMNAKTLKVKLTGTTSVIADSLSVIFRRFWGKR